MWKFIKKIRKSNKGSVAIEFSLILPIIILFSFGFFEFCRVVFTQSILNYSAAQASRYAMVNINQESATIADTDAATAYLASKQSEIEVYAKESFILIDESKVADFTVEIIPSQYTSLVNVSIDYDYSTFIPLMPTMNFTLRADSDSFLVR